MWIGPWFSSFEEQWWELNIIASWALHFFAVSINDFSFGLPVDLFHLFCGDEHADRQMLVAAGNRSGWTMVIGIVEVASYWFSEKKSVSVYFCQHRAHSNPDLFLASLNFWHHLSHVEPTNPISLNRLKASFESSITHLIDNLWSGPHGAFLTSQCDGSLKVRLRIWGIR